MLDNIPGRTARLTPASLCPPGYATPLAARGSRARSARKLLRQPSHRGSLEIPRSAPRRFLSAVKRIAEHFCDGVCSAEKVNLKTVRLFFCTRFGIDPPDVYF
jgi:hypothetical protein